MAKIVQKANKVTGTSYSTKSNIAYAKARKGAADAAVKADKGPKPLKGAMGTAQSKTKSEAAMRVRKAIDASKTAGRAKNVESKLKPKMTPEDAAMKKLLEKKYGKIYG